MVSLTENISHSTEHHHACTTFVLLLPVVNLPAAVGDHVRGNLGSGCLHAAVAKRMGLPNRHLTLHFTFMPSMWNVGYCLFIVFSLLTLCFGLTGLHQVYRLLWWRNMFRPNRPSSGVQVVVMKEYVSAQPAFIRCTGCCDEGICFGPTGHHQVYRLLWWRNMFRPNRPSSGVQLVVMKEYVSAQPAMIRCTGCCDEGICFGPTGHHQVYRLLWWRNMFRPNRPWSDVHVVVMKEYVSAQPAIIRCTGCCDEGICFGLTGHRHTNLYTWWWPVRPKHVVSV
jgi:hypothetical protein